MSIEGSAKQTQIEKEHVQNVYDSIAQHFSHTRHHPWPRVKAFVENLADHSLLADIGCGNGKYMGLNSKIYGVGCDVSTQLLYICADRKFETFACNALKVPLQSQRFDAAICIAVLHHLSNVENRLQVLRELKRIVKVGGQIALHAWAFEQDENSKRKFNTQDEMVEWKLQMKHLNPNIGSEHGEVDPDNRWVVYKRYCHLYHEGELEDLISSIPGLKVRESTYDRSNWCIIVDRVSE